MAKSHQGLFWAGITCFLLAVGAYVLAREQERIRLKFGDAPQKITVAQLAEKGGVAWCLRSSSPEARDDQRARAELQSSLRE